MIGVNSLEQWQHHHQNFDGVKRWQDIFQEEGGKGGKILNNRFDYYVYYIALFSLHDSCFGGVKEHFVCRHSAATFA